MRQTWARAFRSYCLPFRFFGSRGVNQYETKSVICCTGKCDMQRGSGSGNESYGYGQVAAEPTATAAAGNARWRAGVQNSGNGPGYFGDQLFAS
jgi:hypothetical protein